MSLFDTIKFITGHPLNRGHGLGSVLRFIKWQVGGRLVPGAVVVEWVNGSRFFVKPGETGLTGNIYAGLQEFSDMAFVLHALRDTDLFVDIGANVGSYTLLACSAVGAGGVAFEPVPSTYERLIDNVHLNKLNERVRCLNQGVGSRKGKIDFTSDSDTTNHALASGEQSDQSIRVQMTTLDAVLQDSLPTMLKIDVEGYETPVLEGAQETLKKQSLHSVIVELNGSGRHYGFDESKILELMFDHGFTTYSYDPWTRTLNNLGGKNTSSGNTLFIRDEPWVAERLRNAAKVSVHGCSF